MSWIEEVFGSKISKNGYKYDRKVFTQVAKNIFELYRKVTRKHKVTNGQINKTFAWGVSCWFNGDPFDWAKYSIYCGKYVTKLRKMKATNLAQQVESGGVHERKWTSRPPTSRQSKIEFEVIDAKGLKNKGVQFSSKGQLMSKFSRF